MQRVSLSCNTYWDHRLEVGSDLHACRSSWESGLFWHNSQLETNLALLMVVSWAFNTLDCVVQLHELLVGLFLVFPKLWKFPKAKLLRYLEDNLYYAHKFSDSWQLGTYWKVNYSTELTLFFEVCNRFINFLFCCTFRGRKWNLSGYSAHIAYAYKSQRSSVRAVKNHLCNIEA